MESKDNKERENFFRICILVVDHIKNALVEMFKYYLCKKNMSFEEFIDEHIADIKHLRRSTILYKHEVDKLIVGDKAISGITVDNLELTLVRRLLDNLCLDLFMDGCKGLHDFLKKNQHDIYHLFKFNEPCCQCSQDYKFPVISRLLQEDQYKEMFILSPCTNCTGTNGTVCSGSSCIVTEDIKLDIKFNYKIKKVVFGHFSPIFKAMLKFTEIRNKAYGHADATVISNVIYDGYKQVIEENIMVLAGICGNEDKTWLALVNVQKPSYNKRRCIQCKDILSEQMQRDRELMEEIGKIRQIQQESSNIQQENSQMLQENSQILREIPQHFQKITEEIKNLKVTKTNLTKDDQAGAMASFSQESSSNNISTGNDQSGQGYQSSIETDAEPYTNSVNNDLENKRDIYDGVVLHDDDDRDAAIEFITNMERENPDLNINITIYENLQPGTSDFESAAEIFDSCRYLFVFVTQNFVKANIKKFLSEIAAVQTLTFQEKNARLIPVKTDKTFYPALAPLKPLNYDNYLKAKKSQQVPDQHFIKCFRDLITNGRQKYLVN